MTQYESALKGNITPEMESVAHRECLDPRWLCQQVAKGLVVVMKNKQRETEALAVGRGLRTRVNANIGSSALTDDKELERQKMHRAAQAGADALMDLSTGGDLDEMRQMILAETPLCVGTVPLYAVMARLAAKGQPFRQMSEEDVLQEIELQARQGVDFMTIHAGITRRSLSYLEEDPRVAGVVSRGGSFLCKWMKNTGKENPFYSAFDRILEICRREDVTISLGDGFRPGAGCDAGDAAQVAELLELGALVKRCREAGVQVMVEGPGHVPLDQVEMQIALMKRLCHQAPVYVLGPITTDIAPGYDHISSAIGGALAASKGADFLCYVTPAEHLCLPNEEDVAQGVMAARVAAHSGDIAKGIAGSADRDLEMSRRRKALDWEGQFAQAMDPATARQRRKDSQQGEEETDTCTMCGALCSMRESGETL